MKLTMNKRLTIIFAILTVASILLGFFAYRNNKVLVETNQLVSHTRDVLMQAERVLSYVKEFGNGGRGYVIARDSAFLKNYLIAKDSIDPAMERLSRLTRDNPLQKARIDSLIPLVDKRIKFSEANVFLASQGKQKEAMELIASKTGTRYMDTIRSIIERVKQHEEFLLAQRRRVNEESKNAFTTSFYFLLISLISMIGFVFVTIRQDQKYRAATEAELHHRSEVYSQTLVSLGDGVIATDANGIITLLNNAAVTLTGWQRHEAVGKHIAHVFRITHEKTGLTVINQVMAAMQENAIKLLANHTILTRKDGSGIFIDDSGAPIHDLQGNVIGGVLVFRDVTEKKIAEDKLKSSEKKFRVYFENSLAGVMLTAPDGRIMAANPSACNILGMTEEEIIRAGRSGIVDMDDPRIHDFLATRARYGKASGENILIRKDGTRFPAYVSSAMFDSESGEKGTILIFEDITNRKKAEEQIRQMNKHLEKLVEQKTKEVFEKEERYRYALDNMMEGVQIIDFNWRYLYLNDEAVNQSNLGRDQLVGKSMLELYPGIEKTEMFQVLLRSMKSRSSARIDNQFMYSDKSSRWYNLSVLPVPEGLFILSSDITARKVTEQKLKEHYAEMEQANAELKKINSELDRFVYSVSHDLRAPLTSILGILNIVLRDIQNKKLMSEELRLERIMMIRKSAMRLDDFIADILDYSRNARTDVVNEEVNFRDLLMSIEENVRPMVNDLRCDLNFQIEQTMPFVSDKRRIGIVMNNLVSNGIKYRDMNKPYNFVSVNVNVNATEAIIEVSDNGIGIEEKYHGKIFEMFQRMSTQATGSGIGLYIVKEVIEKLHGTITVDSEPGKGTKFTARIPAATRNHA